VHLQYNIIQAVQHLTPKVTSSKLLPVTKQSKLVLRYGCENNCGSVSAVQFITNITCGGDCLVLGNTQAMTMGSGVVANLKLWERSDVLFPSFPLHSFPFPSPSLPSPPLSGGNNFDDFPENQLTSTCTFLCKPAWGNATVSPFPLSWYHLGERHFPLTMGLPLPFSLH